MFDPVNDEQMTNYLTSDVMKPYIEKAKWSIEDIKAYVSHFDGEFLKLQECLFSGLESKLQCNVLFILIINSYEPFSERYNPFL